MHKYEYESVACDICGIYYDEGNSLLARKLVNENDPKYSIKPTLTITIFGEKISYTLDKPPYIEKWCCSFKCVNTFIREKDFCEECDVVKFSTERCDHG